MWAAFLADLLAEYGGTQQGFADAIGKSRASVSHWLRVEPPSAPPGVEVCLRIAAVTRTDATAVLRAAGKGDVATLIEQLYGGPARMRTIDPAVSATDRRLLLQFHALDPATQRAIHTLLDHITAVR